MRPWTAWWELPTLDNLLTTPYTGKVRRTARHRFGKMTASQKNAAFLASTDSATVDSILGNIASHYGISPAEALAEVTDPEAEHLLEYLTGSVRNAVSVLMQRHTLR